MSPPYLCRISGGGRPLRKLKRLGMRYAHRSHEVLLRELPGVDVEELLAAPHADERLPLAAAAANRRHDARDGRGRAKTP